MSHAKDRLNRVSVLMIPEFANTSLLTLNIHDTMKTPVSIGRIVGLVHPIVQERLDLRILESNVSELAKLNPLKEGNE